MRSGEKEKFSDYFGRSVRALSDYLGIGFQIAASFAFFVLGGYWVDEQLGTSPLFLLIGVGAGLTGMILLLIKVVKNANRKGR
ncbi:AtpZ/AtpI family protein [Prosthecochloris sp.]|uniref:AtpZ/AtpI family protein n=1 Tax=Prosthecochloris sp. TaxID=290513 RepID=UPI0025D21260|nr:AtpZ/AtpI family protein [Prosthecochloris sp.]